MISLNKRKNKFARRVTSLRVLFDALPEEDQKNFLKSLNGNSFRKVFENKTFSILNIERVKNAPNHYYYEIDKKKKKNKSHIILCVSDLKIINKNIKYLFNKQVKERG